MLRGHCECVNNTHFFLLNLLQRNGKRRKKACVSAGMLKDAKVAKIAVVSKNKNWSLFFLQCEINIFSSRIPRTVSLVMTQIYFKRLPIQEVII